MAQMRRPICVTLVLIIVLALILDSLPRARRSAATQGAVEIQLAMILDGSNSIGDDSRTVMINGLADAVENHAHTAGSDQ